MKLSITVTLIIGLLITANFVDAQERYVLQYDSPATDNLLTRKAKSKKTKKGMGYIQTALPIGNSLFLMLRR